MRGMSVEEAGMLGYVVKLADSGLVADKGHLLRYAAQVFARTKNTTDVDRTTNKLIKRGYLHRDDRRYVRLTPAGRNAYAKALEALGVRNT